MSYALVIAALALGCLIEIAYAVLPALRRRTTARWMGQQGLPLAKGMAGPIERVRASRRLSQGLGGLVGLGIGALLSLTPVVSGLPLAGPWLTIATTLAGIGVGLGVGALRAALPSPSGPTRVAHATVQPVRALLEPGLLWLARSAATLGLGAGVLVFTLLADPASGLAAVLRTAVLVGLAVLVVVWPATELLAGRLVRRSEPAGSDAELAWQDVLRAELLRDLYALPSTVALFLAVLAVLQQERVDTPAPLVLAVLPMGLMWAILAAMIAQVAVHAGATRPARRWRRLLVPSAEVSPR